MEQGSKTLLIILATALLLGVLVVAINPAYRQTFMAQLRGDPASSPIWRSNREYYPDIALPVAPPPAPAAALSPETSHDAE
jgi:hypothetical protein